MPPMVAIVVLTLLAAPVHALISVTGDDGTCLTAAALSEETVARLGRQDVASTTQFSVAVFRGPVVRAELKSSDGPARSFRASDCREVLESLALAISVALDPTVFLRPPPAPVSPPASAPRPSPPAPLPPPPAPLPPPPAPSVHFVAGVLGGASAGLSSTVTGTFGGLVGVRFDGLALRADVRVDLPTVAQSALNRVTSFAWLSSLFAGWQGRLVRGGLLASIGELRNHVEQGARSAERNQVVGLLGLEAAVRFTPVRWVGLELFARGQVALVRAELVVGSEALWRTWPVHLAVGLAVTTGSEEAARE